jgi:hypothetical protein
VAHQNQIVDAGGGMYSRQEALSLSPPAVIPHYCGTAETVANIESPVLAREVPSERGG